MPEIEMGKETQLPDGVYFIAGRSDSEVNTKTYARYTPDLAAPFPADYIGVKLGHRSIAVALEDLPGNEDGELQLLPYCRTSPKTSEHYSWNKETLKHRFNVFEDFNGKGNTERLKKYGCNIDIPKGEWIPSMGELGLLMMHATDVNRAIELAGGKRIEDWHRSSTEYSWVSAWGVRFSAGISDYDNKQHPHVVRTVTAF